MRFAARPPHPCRSGSPDPDLFGIRRSRTTEWGLPSPGTARDRPSPYGDAGRFFHRRAGACPPRTPLSPSRGGLSPAISLAHQGTARDRPSPYVKGRRFFSPSRGGQAPANSIVTMCVSPSVVCDRLITNGSGSGEPELQGLARERWRGTGPRPTVRGWRFFTVARGPVPRDLSRAPGHGEGQALALRLRGQVSFHHSAGACPPRALDCADDGEGQALALREGAAFFSP